MICLSEIFLQGGWRPGLILKKTQKAIFCHSEHSGRISLVRPLRFFTPLRSVQNDKNYSVYLDCNLVLELHEAVLDGKRESSALLRRLSFLSSRKR